MLCGLSLLQVFGSFVVCRDRSVMDAVAASGAPVDGITLDGDVLRRKGTISGGFINASRSKLNTHKTVRGAPLCCLTLKQGLCFKVSACTASLRTV
jgi:hypothetical protein